MFLPAFKIAKYMTMKNTARTLKTLAIIVVLTLLFCGTALGEAERFTIPLDNAVFLGPADAPITIIEFLDFQ